MRRERDEHGKFTEEIRLKEVVEVLDGDEPVKTAKEVGEELGCTSETARQKLLELRDRGVVKRKKVGAGAVVWWLAGGSNLEKPGKIDPEDPLFGGGAIFSSEEPIDEEDIDEILYGEVEG